MSASEYRAWRALALIEHQIAELVRLGTPHDTAYRMAWTPSTDDDEPAPPTDDE